jgi:hypothetical protein
MTDRTLSTIGILLIGFAVGFVSCVALHSVVERMTWGMR